MVKNRALSIVLGVVLVCTVVLAVAPLGADAVYPTAEELRGLSGRCPDFTIRCSSDRGCDEYCGTPGWGDCIGGCCACLG